MVKKPHCIIWVKTVSLYKQKQMIFTKTLHEMLRQGLTLQIINQTDQRLKETLIGLMKDELGRKIMKEFLR